MLIFSYPSVLTYVLDAQKNRLIDTVLLSTHNIVWWDHDKIQTHPSFKSCSYCMQEWKRSIQNWKH